MSEKEGADRRTEPRFRCGYFPIQWCGDMVEYRRPGYLYDTSATGLSYRTLGSGKPDVGERVLILPRQEAVPINCQVMRVTRDHEGRFIIGCRRLETIDAQLTPAPDPPEYESRAYSTSTQPERVRLVV